MNKSELIEAMSKVSGQTKGETERSLEAFIDVISRNITSNDGVKLIGFGSFMVSERKARIGRNPKTGDEIDIPARKVPIFRPGKELREAAMN